MPRRPAVHHRTTVGPVHGQSGNSRQADRALNTGSKPWRLIRKRILVRDNYTCQQCHRYGNHVDHKDGDDSNMADSNLWTLCRYCHGIKTRAEQGIATLLPRIHRRPLVPVKLIAGPPGSGKSTMARDLAARHKGPGAPLLIDLDEIKAELSGRSIHESPDDVFAMAVWERNRRLIELADPGPFGLCLFVAMAPRLNERRHWRSQLNATSIVLEVPRGECLRRIAADPTRRGRPADYWERLVDDWWSNYARDAQGSGERVIH